MASEGRTVVCFEAPGRVAATLADLAAACGPDRLVGVAREITKLHEEVWRGKLADAVAHVGSTDPRGEYVIVLGPATEVPEREPDDAALDAELDEVLAAGASARDAAAEVAARLGVPRRRAYEAAIRRRAGPTGGMTFGKAAVGR